MNQKDKKLGVCVVGLGMGYAHAKAYSAMENVELYVCDIDDQKAKKAQSELNVKGVFTNVEAAISSPKVDALDVSLPHDMHRPVCLEVVSAGKHFMTEKPLARTLEEADEMIAAAEKAGVKLMVAENQRFWPSAIKARQLIDQGLLGSIFLIRVYEMWHYKPRGWRCSKQRVGGGNLIDSGIHAVNTLRLLAGSNAAQVFALNTGIVLQEMEGEDTNLVVVKFHNGAMGNLITSWAIPASGPQVHFAVYGTDGCLWQQTENLFLHSRRLPQGLSYHKEPAPVEVPSVNTYEAECAHFVDCILQDKQPITNGREARKDLEIVAAAYQSAKTGKAIELPL
ncbi:MAG: Gfo/Idh/MocA family oxidoreductase [Candidatus Latescibacteria bacterium]|nr:Gfo/Idh/MocA family oxidoreductase [Candidatus Latescibacterota bacterium]